jgi:hypothetical protein
MFDHHINLRAYFQHDLNASLERPMAWLKEQSIWATGQVLANPEDPYWVMVGLVIQQFEGLVQGYQARAAVEPVGSDAVGHLTYEDGTNGAVPAVGGSSSCEFSPSAFNLVAPAGGPLQCCFVSHKLPCVCAAAAAFA